MANIIVTMYVTIITTSSTALIVTLHPTPRILLFTPVAAAPPNENMSRNLIIFSVGGAAAAGV